MKLILACCKLYISESKNGGALELISQAAKPYPEAAIINKFQDEAYNRVGYTLVSHFSPNPSSSDGGPLRKAVFSMVKEAIDSINLEFHCGTHPRLGVVDHICFHPLAQASLDQVAALAKLVASDIGYKLQGTCSLPLVLKHLCFEKRELLFLFQIVTRLNPFFLTEFLMFALQHNNHDKEFFCYPGHVSIPWPLMKHLLEHSSLQEYGHRKLQH